MSDISIIGAGSWGTALSVVLHKNGHKITIWSALAPEIEMLKEKHEQAEKLPGVILPDDIMFTTDLKEAIEGKDMLVLAVPSPFTRSTAKAMSPFVAEGQLIVSVAKGIEENTLMTLSEIIMEEIPQCEVAVLCGPSHAEEVGKEIPTSLVAGAKKRATAELVQNTFMSEVLRVYTSPDVLGMEIGASLKNVIALAAGMADGLGYGDNTKAALITRGISEMGRLALAMGAKYETLSGLTGMGDLIVTCASKHSRNRRAGYLMGQGYTMQQAMDEVKMVVEGVYSAKAAIALAKKYHVDMPIIEQVNEVLFEDKPAKDAVKEMTTWNGSRRKGVFSRMEKIRIKYFTDKIEKLTYIDGKSDWIDLRASEEVEMKAGEFKLIPLGVAMELPKGYEAHIMPRSSSYKNFGIIQANSCGIVDGSYCGDNDMWRLPAIAMRDTVIHVNDRIAQFRIVENQPQIHFEEVESLGNQDRGGFGSTGIQ